MVKDSGNRKKFKGGSVRDIQDGKGREDLLPHRELADFEKFITEFEGVTFLDCIASYTETLEEKYLFEALKIFCEERGWNIYQMFMEVAIHYEEGAKKYDPNNWRKIGGGIPTHCYLDSGLRHYFKYKQGIEDEAHDRAVVWNIIGLLYTLHHFPDKIDFDFFEERKEFYKEKA